MPCRSAKDRKKQRKEREEAVHRKLSTAMFMGMPEMLHEDEVCTG